MPEDIDRRLREWAEFQNATGDPAVKGAVEQRVLGALEPGLRPVKPVLPQWALALAFFGVFAIAGLLLSLGMQNDGLRLMTRAQELGATIFLAGSGLLFAVVLAARIVPGSRQRLRLGWTLAATGVGFGAVIGLLFPWTLPHAFVAEGWPCALMELEIAPVAAVVYLMLARRGVVFGGAGLGAAIAGIAAFFALTVQQFHCMFQQAPHLLVWHGGAAAILIAAGALIGGMRGRA